MEGYELFGVMLDCSRNAVMKPGEVKRFASVLAGMGYNALMLYTEDTFEVEGEPWFSYMRGGYTAKELREIDAHLKTLGMELIPCIQTLAHFTNLCKMPHYADYFDVDDILLVDDEKTYALIENIFCTLEKTFTSRTVHIGMDEAHLVGLGKYLDRHGFCDRTRLLVRHLGRVCEIARRHGFRPVMWSDMFFRLANEGDYYGKDVEFGDEIKSLIPPDVSLAYWDYYHQEQANYDGMLEAHRRLGREIWFAGGAWSWMGFAPMNGYSLATMEPAMKSVRAAGVKNVFITMWGDDGKECSFYALLPSLYALASMAGGEYDREKIAEGFLKRFGIAYGDFLSLDLPNLRRADQEQTKNENLCKCLFYSDPFTGYFDASLTFLVDYAAYAEKLRAVKKKGVYASLFDLEEKLCLFLESKYRLGVLTRQAYRKNDFQALKALAQNDYARAAERLEQFIGAFRTVWLSENKPFGLEVHEARMGGLLLRLRACADRILNYVNGGCDKIDELEHEPMPLAENDFINHNLYVQLISFGKM